MTPEKKARELCSTFLQNTATHHYNFQDYQARQCALLAVDEILRIERLFCENKEANMSGYQNTSSIEYWREVKKEIEKL